jgi:hypothetical protein
MPLTAPSMPPASTPHHRPTVDSHLIGGTIAASESAST